MFSTLHEKSFVLYKCTFVSSPSDLVESLSCIMFYKYRFNLIYHLGYKRDKRLITLRAAKTDSNLYLIIVVVLRLQDICEQN